MLSDIGPTILDLFNSRRLNNTFLLAIFAHVLVNLLVNYRLFGLLFSEATVSNRAERWIYSHQTISQVFRDSLDLFLHGQYHAASYHFYLLPIIFIFLITAILKKDYCYNTKILFSSIFIMIFVSFLYGFQSWDAFDFFKSKITFLRTFQIGRFYMLFPLLIYSALACSFFLINKYLKLKHIGFFVILFITLMQTSFLFYQNKSFLPVKSYLHDFLKEENSKLTYNYPSFRSFYSSDLFQKISDFIAKPKSEYRIASIGLFPSVTQYNGFYTIDGYYGNYSLDYKHKFRRIIEAELAKSKSLTNYFDNWGNRAYIFTKELGLNYLYNKYSDREIKNLELNISALKDLNCSYIFSAVPIKNAASNDLHLLNTFETTTSWWKIYLYQVL